jgi:malyl-CoA/(S)-citramalyl-CoA lyase
MVATGRPTRLHRSELTVPGSNRHMLERAPDLGADVVMLDLEDSVPPPEKELARAQVIHALTELDWSGSSVSLRINGLDTPWCYRDLVDIVERAGEALDAITVPKVGRPSDVEFVCTLLAQIEQAMGIARPIGVSVLIETAEGMACVEQIASTCPHRLEAMIFGVGGYAASLHSLTGTKRGPDAEYAVPTDPDDEGKRDFHWGDQWHYALARIAVACRAHGLRPIDGPFGDFGDTEGYLAAARRAAVLGYEGKWAVHPSQIPLANEVFTPRHPRLERTPRILETPIETSDGVAGGVSEPR